MKRVFHYLMGMFFIAVALATPASAQTLKKIRIGYPSLSFRQSNVWVAKEVGLFNRYGLEVEPIFLRGGQIATQALAGGDPPIVNIGTVVQADLTGFDLVLVAAVETTYDQIVFARPGITKLEQLKGKIIGTDRPATPVAYGTLVALKKMGLTPKDVQLRPLGSSPQIVAAFYAGQIAGGVGSPPASFKLERDGFHSLVSLLDVPYQNVGLVVRRGRMDELGSRLVPLLRAVRAGVERYYADKAFAMKVIGKYTKETDHDVLDRSYEFYKKAGFRRELVTSEPGLQGILDFLSESIPEAKTAKPAQFFDDRFVRQVNSGK